MNHKQRLKNRDTARELGFAARMAAHMKHTCENCGEKGAHWVQMPFSLADIFAGEDPQGFWTCAKYYGPDGRRINP
jgi:hypothetical protein